MKALVLSITATLVGAAMLVVGIAGVAGAFDDGSSKSSGSSDVTDFNDCKGGDPRLSEFTSFHLIGDAGRGTVLVTCQSGAREATLIGDEVQADQPRTVALWIYRNRKRAELIGSAPQEAGDPSAFVSGPIPDRTEEYRKFVVTEEPANDPEPAAPAGPILLQAALAG